MNDQCHECKVRKWCYEQEPIEDWTCEYYKSDSEYVDFLDDCLSEEESWSKEYGEKTTRYDISRTANMIRSKYYNGAKIRK